MMKRFAIVKGNKVVDVRITHDINHLKEKLGKDYDIIELKDKKVERGQTWSHFPTFKKLASKVRNLFAKKAE
jgi:predicted HD phosphohydrolase